MFEYTQDELNNVKETFFLKNEKVILKSIPVKEKKKYLCFVVIINTFEKNRNYTESEINEHLKEIYPFDYTIIRR